MARLLDLNLIESALLLSPLLHWRGLAAFQGNPLLASCWALDRAFARRRRLEPARLPKLL